MKKLLESAWKLLNPNRSNPMAKKDFGTGINIKVVQPPKFAQEDSIREQAYYKWEAAGCPPGDGLEFWVAAEAEINTMLEGPPNNNFTSNGAKAEKKKGATYTSAG